MRNFLLTANGFLKFHSRISILFMKWAIQNVYIENKKKKKKKLFTDVVCRREKALSENIFLYAHIVTKILGVKFLIRFCRNHMLLNRTYKISWQRKYFHLIKFQRYLTHTSIRDGNFHTYIISIVWYKSHFILNEKFLRDV